MGTGIKTVNSMTTNGSAGNLAKLLSSSAGTARTLRYTGTTNVALNYVSLQDSAQEYIYGRAIFAGANSTNVSNNTGWYFTAIVSNFATEKMLAMFM